MGYCQLVRQGAVSELELVGMGDGDGHVLGPVRAARDTVLFLLWKRGGLACCVIDREESRFKNSRFFKPSKPNISKGKEIIVPLGGFSVKKRVLNSKYLDKSVARISW